MVMVACGDGLEVVLGIFQLHTRYAKRTLHQFCRIKCWHLWLNLIGASSNFPN